MQRKIVRIDEEKCDGCGDCVPACAEGAIALVGGKARLSSDVLCDGLGACLGECPRGAITIEERDAAAFDEEAVKAHLLSFGVRVPAEHAAPPAPAASQRPRLSIVSDGGPAHSHHSHGGCPGSRPMAIRPVSPLAARAAGEEGGGEGRAPRESRLAQWPVQLHLVPVSAPWLRNADLLVAADCVPFAYAGFHEGLLAGRALVVGCPKLDDIGAYVEKLGRMVASNDLRSVTVARMEVPCCGGISMAAQRALAASGKSVPFRDVVVGVDGTIRE
jgi:NAD-dependent dihydropyrimidine dehydrogenase PreA subunit